MTTVPWANHERDLEAYDLADWQRLRDGLWDHAVLQIKSGTEVRETFWIFQKVYGRIDMFSVDLGQFHNAPRNMQMNALAAMLRFKKIPAYGVTSESWYYRATSEDDPVAQEAARRWGSLRHEPKRKEALICVLVTAGGVKLHKFGDIVRLGGVMDEGVVSDIVPIDDGGVIKGNLSSLYERQINPAHAKMLKAIIE